VRLVAIETLSQIAQVPVRQENALENVMKKAKYGIWCQVWHHLVETRLSSLGYPIRKGTNSSFNRVEVNLHK
jgi:hypothetical protein